jgi:ABC-2 type transport system ATP-binding protein
MDEAEYCHRLALMNRGRIVALGAPNELKQQLQAFKLMNLESSNPLESMRALENIPGIRDVAVFGKGLHVTVEDLATAEKNMRESLAEKGISIQRLEPIQPSMEDVFVALIEEEERKAS